MPKNQPACRRGRENILILHNIRSVENVGAMFRTADAVGINKIYLTGYTPAPLDRFGRKRKDLAKSALGAEEFVKWEAKKNLFALLRSLRQEKYFIIAIEQDKKSVDYKNLRLRSGRGNAFIVGAEVSGIPKSILKKCDIIAEIPMKGKKESLNVSVALGVALFRILRI
ncbi:TrmH family RNA methyltransferase [Patescibacteria group bacterium]|nr:TrmH family RNA methyltransferase [Patescibacteria group bacterium]